MYYLSSKIAGPVNIDFFSVRQTEEWVSDQFVILLVQKGSIEAGEEGASYRLSTGDLLLLEPERTYSLRPMSHNQILRFSCDRGMLEAHMPPGHRLRINSAARNGEDYGRVAKILEEMALVPSDSPNAYAFISLFYQLMDQLIPNCMVEIPEEKEDNIQERIRDRIQTISRYIEQHYYQQISLQKLAEEVYLSPQYLSKFIKQHMGVTFKHYLNKVRMEHAFEDLIHTNELITQIAFNNGFFNISTFNKVFQEEFGESPSSVRMKNKAALESTGHTEPASEMLSAKHSRDDVDLDISFDGESVPFFKSWRDTINIGPLSAALLPGFFETFSKAQQFLHFSYIRFSNLLTEEILPPAETSDGYDFSAMDRLFDYFLTEGIRPFIDIAQKPTQVTVTYPQKTVREMLSVSDHPLEDEEGALDAVIRHCAARFGKDEVSKWRFEIWAWSDEVNETSENPREYWQRFRRVSNLIKSVLPDCRVGGPGFNTSGGKERMELLLQEMKRQQAVPDFFSICIHFYEAQGYQVEQENAPLDRLKILSVNPDYCLNVFHACQKQIRQYTSREPEIYVTELSSGLNMYNHVASSAFQAAFLLKNMLSLFRETKCVAYWRFSDIQNTPDVYLTGMGLLDFHGIPKPAFYSYKFLSELGSGLADCGDQYIATTDGPGRYQFLTCHYTHYSRQYCFVHHYPLSVEQTYEAFEGEGIRTVHLRMRGLSGGQYKCSKYVLNREYGSVLDRFIKGMGENKVTPKDLDRFLLGMGEEETLYVCVETMPRLEIFYPEIASGELSLDLELDDHEVVLLKFEKTGQNPPKS